MKQKWYIMKVEKINGERRKHMNENGMNSYNNFIRGYGIAVMQRKC